MKNIPFDEQKNFFCLSGRPFPLQNCSVSNQSSESLQIECMEGFDGGLPQGFLLELVEMPGLRLIRNLSLPVSENEAITVAGLNLRFLCKQYKAKLRFCRFSHYLNKLRACKT